MFSLWNIGIWPVWGISRPPSQTRLWFWDFVGSRSFNAHLGEIWADKYCMWVMWAQNVGAPTRFCGQRGMTRSQDLLSVTDWGLDEPKQARAWMRGSLTYHAAAAYHFVGRIHQTHDLTLWWLNYTLRWFALVGGTGYCFLCFFDVFFIGNTSPSPSQDSAPPRKKLHSRTNVVAVHCRGGKAGDDLKTMPTPKR